MLSDAAEKAIEDALRVGKAVLKILAPNDVRRPDSHQYGALLPQQCWRLFTSNPPKKGANTKSFPRILWWDGTETNSCVTWSGQAKSEYRLTCFGRRFPHLTSHDTGSLLVLIPESHEFFRAYILDLDEDVDGVFAALNVEILEEWGSYFDRSESASIPDTDNCVSRQFRRFAQSVCEFPTTAEFSATTRSILLECDPAIFETSLDRQILELVRREYELFKLVERILCTNEVQGKLFPSVDKFIETALKILNRRKSRAGRSLENHFADILHRAGFFLTFVPEFPGRPTYSFLTFRHTTLSTTPMMTSLLLGSSELVKIDGGKYCKRPLG